MDIRELNEIAEEYLLNPEYVVGRMSYEEFDEWIKDEPIEVLTNLMNLLAEHEMFEYAAITKKEIERQKSFKDG